MNENNENKCEVNGVDYVAVVATSICDGCDGEDRDYNELCRYLGMCEESKRSDERNIVWVKKVK